MNVERFDTLEEYEKWLFYIEDDIKVLSVKYRQGEGCIVEYEKKES